MAMLKDSFNSEVPVRRCHHCEHEGKPVSANKFNEVHGYAFQCEKCGKFLTWGGKNKAIVVDGERQRSTQWTAKRLNVEFCQMCLRNQNTLGTRETLEAHHVVPIETGGPDSPENIWIVCTPCHKQIHFMRIYLNEHQQRHVDAWSALQRFKENNPDLYARVSGKGGSQ